MSSEGLEIEARGTGPAIVFTHGFGRAGDTWGAVAGALAGDHHVVTWSMRGHGGSDDPSRPYTRDDALADMAAVVDGAIAESGGPVTLVGHSLGGYFSLAYTLGRPQTVRGLVLLSTGPGFRNPDSREKYNRTIGKVAAAAGLSDNAAAVGLHHDSMVIDRLAEITCPASMISGTGDLEIYRVGARYLSERLPDATLVEIDGAAHEPHVDRPDQVTEAIRAHEALLAKR